MSGRRTWALEAFDKAQGVTSPTEPAPNVLASIEFHERNHVGSWRGCTKQPCAELRPAIVAAVDRLAESPAEPARPNAADEPWEDAIRKWRAGQPPETPFSEQCRYIASDAFRAGFLAAAESSDAEKLREALRASDVTIGTHGVVVTVRFSHDEWAALSESGSSPEAP